MLNYQAISESFFSLVGLRQTSACNVQDIDDSLTTSESTLFANDLASNWLTNEKISLCIADFQKGASYQYDVWNNATPYTTGQKIVYEGFIYKALQNTTGNQPDTSPTFWKVLTEEPSLSNWLKRIKTSAINETLHKVLWLNNEMNKSYSIAPDSFGSVFQGNTKSESITNLDNNFYGFVARPIPTQGAQLEIKRIGLILDTVGSFNFYVFHSSQPTAIKTFNITVGASDINKFTWYNIQDTEGNPCILDYNNDITNSGGDYYLGVFRNEFTGIEQFLFTNYSNSYNPILLPYAKYYTFSVIEVSEADLNGTGLFNLDKVQYGKAQVPFNLEVFASEDHTYLITRGKRSWASAIQYAIAIKILSEMMASTEVGKISAQARADINMVLNGNKDAGIIGLTQKFSGLVKKIIAEYECADGFEKNKSLSYNFA